MNRFFTSVISVNSRKNAAVNRYVQNTMLAYEKMIYPFITSDNAYMYMYGSTRACQGIESILASILETSGHGNTISDDIHNRIIQLKETRKIKQDMLE